MSRFGLDYTGRISAANHKAVGSSFACRYLSGGQSKDLTSAEVKNLDGGGVDIVLVWETTGRGALAGHSAGVADAKAALAEANRLGFPSHRPIYFAVDFDETAAQTGTMDAYFQGVVSVLGKERSGAYGSYYVIERVVGAGIVDYGWQTYAWSGGRVSTHANLLQYSNSHVVAGVGVDYNRSLKPDFGQWGFVPPRPVVASPTGQWKVLVTWNADQRKWSVAAQPGDGVKMGGHPLLHGIELRVDERHGVWTAKTLPVVKSS